MRRVTDWVIIGSLATAAGTLALAGATFASIRSANRSARNAERAGRIAERSLLAGQRPLLVSSRLQDPAQKVQFAEGNWLTVAGGGAAAQATDGAIYLGISVPQCRNRPGRHARVACAIRPADRTVSPPA